MADQASRSPLLNPDRVFRQPSLWERIACGARYGLRPGDGETA